MLTICLHVFLFTWSKNGVIHETWLFQICQIHVLIHRFPTDSPHRQSACRHLLFYFLSGLYATLGNMLEMVTNHLPAFQSENFLNLSLSQLEPFTYLTLLY